MRIVIALLALAACGDGIALPDAGSGLDADSTRGLVKVHLRGANADGKTVLFQNADSSLVLATETNASGDASAWMAPGGFVTVFEDHQINIGQFQLSTWTDVQIGDELVLDRPTFVDQNIASLLLQIPAHEDNSEYDLYTPCAIAPSRVTGTVTEPKAPPFFLCAPRQHVLVVALDGLTLVPEAYLFRPDVIIPSGPNAGTLLMTQPYQPINSRVIVTDNEDGFLSVQQKLAGTNFVAFNNGSLPGGGEMLMQMPTPASGTIITYAERGPNVFPKDPIEIVQGRDAAVVWGPGTQTVEVDLGAVTFRKFTTLPRFDPTTSRLAWTETASGVGGNTLFGRLTFFSLAGFFVEWNILTPRTDETEVRLPVLPHAMLRPNSDEPIFATELAMLQLDGGYDAAKSYLLGQWSPSGINTSIWFPIRGPSGSVRYRSLN